MAVIKDFNEILDSLKKELVDQIPTANTTNNSFWVKIFRPFSLVLNQNYEFLQNVQDSNRVNIATGEDLDQLASNYGITRKSAVKSTGYLLFSGANGTVIPNSSQAQTTNNVNESPLVFQTTEAGTSQTVTDVTISFADTNPDTILDSNNGFGIFSAGDYVYISGSISNDGIQLVDVATAGVLTVNGDLVVEPVGASITISKVIPSQSVIGGDSDNVGANTITILTSPIVGVTGVSNPLAFSGGIDEEIDGDEVSLPVTQSKIDTSTLRGRILFKLFNNTGKTTKTGYELTTLTVPGVATAFAVSNIINPPDISIYITGTTGNGIPTLQLIASAQAALQLDENKDPLDTITILGATGIGINATYNITAEAGYTIAQKATLQSNIETNLTNFVNGLGQNENVLIEALDNVVFQTPGVFNFTRTLPVSDTVITLGQKAIIGTLNITIA